MREIKNLENSLNQGLYTALVQSQDGDMFRFELDIGTIFGYMYDELLNEPES